MSWARNNLLQGWNKKSRGALLCPENFICTRFLSTLKPKAWKKWQRMPLPFSHFPLMRMVKISQQIRFLFLSLMGAKLEARLDFEGWCVNPGERWWARCPTIWMYLMSSPVKNVQNDKFYVHFTRIKKILRGWLSNWFSISNSGNGRRFNRSNQMTRCRYIFISFSWTKCAH